MLIEQKLTRQSYPHLIKLLNNNTNKSTFKSPPNKDPSHSQQLPPIAGKESSKATQTPVERHLPFHHSHLQSHAFLQTYNAILPTSLISLRFSTRGYSPWRPAAVISTIVSEKTNTNSFFMILLFILIHPVRDKHKIIRKGRLFFRKGSSCAKWLTFRGDPTSFKKKRQLFSNEQQYSRAYLLSPVVLFFQFITKPKKEHSQRQFQNINWILFYNTKKLFLETPSGKWVYSLSWQRPPIFDYKNFINCLKSTHPEPNTVAREPCSCRRS